MLGILLNLGGKFSQRSLPLNTLSVAFNAAAEVLIGKHLEWKIRKVELDSTWA